MKKIAFSLLFVIACTVGAYAQKFALVDMEYILKNIPSYEMANEQLNQVSLRWQKEVEAKAKEADRKITRGRRRGAYVQPHPHAS